MSDINPEFPLWGVAIWHSEPGATNPWNRVFNSQVTSNDYEDKKVALRKAVAYFQGDGLNPITIYSVEMAPLRLFEEGGENA